MNQKIVGSAVDEMAFLVATLDCSLYPRTVGGAAPAVAGCVRAVAG